MMVKLKVDKRMIKGSHIMAVGGGWRWSEPWVTSGDHSDDLVSGGHNHNGSWSSGWQSLTKIEIIKPIIIVEFL